MRVGPKQQFLLLCWHVARRDAKHKTLFSCLSPPIPPRLHRPLGVGLHTTLLITDLIPYLRYRRPDLSVGLPNTLHHTLIDKTLIQVGRSFIIIPTCNRDIFSRSKPGKHTRCSRHPKIASVLLRRSKRAWCCSVK